MSNGNRKCILCGKEYKFCRNCEDQYRKDETWRNLYCSENCKNIFNVLSMSANEHINKENANNMLNNLDLSNINNFRQDFKMQIQDIRGSVQKTETKDSGYRGRAQSQRKREFVKDDYKK